MPAKKLRILLPLWLLAFAGLPAAQTAQGTRPATRPAEPVNLLQGSTWLYSTDGGKTFSKDPPVAPAGKSVSFIARAEFDAAEPSQYVVLEFTPNLPPALKATFTLNDQEIKGPLAGMSYRTIPAIGARMLNRGRNVLAAAITAPSVGTRRGKPRDAALSLNVSLAGLRAGHLKIQTGPILGAFGKDYFTVTCRTNMPAQVTLNCAQITDSATHEGRVLLLATSQTGLVHRFLVRDPPTTIRVHTGFFLGARVGDHFVTARIDPPEALAKKVRFVAMGDSRSNPEDWAEVAQAVFKQRPNWVVFTGDMVSRGSDDSLWDTEFFGQAKDLFESVPFYPVVGNHEGNAPVIDAFFYTPTSDGRGRNWAQTLGPVLLIGVDGRQDWPAGRENATWLEKTLAESKAKFIFLADHYPAWGSGPHAAPGKDGQPRERSVRQGREVILPLLEKYKATAFLAGHDHCYERSQPPGGVTVIITGGAGAPRYPKLPSAARGNPYSKVFLPQLHYCLFEIEGDTCTMKALTPEGEEIDTCRWKARP